MTNSEILIGLPAYQITDITMHKGVVRFFARYTGPVACPHCNSSSLRNKLKEVNGIADPHSPSHLRRELLDEREVVAV